MLGTTSRLPVEVAEAVFLLWLQGTRMAGFLIINLLLLL